MLMMPSCCRYDAMPPLRFRAAPAAAAAITLYALRHALRQRHGDDELPDAYAAFSLIPPLSHAISHHVITYADDIIAAIIIFLLFATLFTMVLRFAAIDAITRRH